MVQKPEAKDEENKPKVEEKVPFICAAANGLSQPLMALIFGKLINTFSSTDPSHIVKEVSNYYILI